MKPTQTLFWNKWMKNGRRPAKPPMRFTECKKLELKDTVSSGNRHSSDLACNAQMMDMLTCFKTHDFDQSKCSSQITTFNKCYQTHLENVARAKQVKNKDEPLPRQAKLTMSQVNHLLKRYPQPR